MPLLNKKPFVIRPPPDDLDPDEEIFVCQWTNEAFRDYEHYVDRTIQCSSLIWSCELTGRSGLTYREAVDSEAEAKRQIESFPDALRRAVLFLASQVRRNGIGLLVEDVFAFYRERYVEGEDLELRFQDQKYDARVVSVCLSDHIYEAAVPDWHAGMAYGYKYVAAVVGPHPDAFLYRVEYVSSGVPVNSPTCVSRRSLSRRKFSKEMIKLILRFSMHRAGSSEKTPWVPHIVERYSLDRPPSHFYYLAYNPAAVDPQNGVVVSEFLPTLATEETGLADGKNNYSCPVVTKSGLTAEESQIVASSPLDCRQTRSSIFPPLSMSSPLSVNQVHLKRTMEVLEQLSHSSLSPSERKVLWEEEVARRQEEKQVERALKKQELESLKLKREIDKHKKKEEKRLVLENLRMSREEEKSKKKEEKLKVIELEKLKKKEDRERERERVRKEREIAREAYLEWARPRDDLECEDHKPLPRPTPVHSVLKSDELHEALMLLEFMQTFQQFLSLEEPYEDGYTLELIEEALVSCSSKTPLCAIISSLLKGIFHLQDAEEECKPAVLSNNVSQDQPGTSRADDTDAEGSQPVEMSSNDNQNSQTSAEMLPKPADTLMHEMVTEKRMSDCDRVSGGDTSVCDGERVESMEIDNVCTTQKGQSAEFECNVGLTECQQGEDLTSTGEDEVAATSAAFDSIESARAAFLWPLHHQGALLSEIPLEPLTVSEVLRLHLRCAGGRAFSQVANFRYTRRGGFTDSDDPVSELKSSDPGLVKKLETELIYCLTVEEKLKLLSTLSNQILTFAAVRDFMEESMTQYRQSKRKLKELQQEIEKRRREEHVLRKQQRREEKVKKVNGEVKNDERMIDLVCTDKMERAEGENRKKFGTEEESRSGCTSSSENEDDEVSKNREEEDSKDWRSELNKREAELLEQMVLEGAPYNLCPLGVDRIYQTYWLFPSLPAVFVQQADNMSLRLVQSQLSLRPRVPLPLYDSSALPSTGSLCGWSLYTKVQEIESLELALNQRGFREKALREQLRRQRLWIARSVADSDHTIEHLSGKEIETDEDSLPINGQNEVLECLRTEILDMEDKIYNGSLGCVQCGSRDSWRSHVAHIEFVSCDASSVDDWDRLGAIRSLSKAVLDLAAAVDGRFLSKPLTAEGRKTSLALKDVRNSRWLLKNLKLQLESGCLEQWRASLASCVSLSQVAVHLKTLNRSILWSKSVLNASCRLCRRKGDASLMLLCDGCDRGHHTYCLHPPMEQVPDGDWFCADCKSGGRKRKRGRKSNASSKARKGKKDGKKKRVEDKTGDKKTPHLLDDEYVYDMSVNSRRKSSEARGSDKAGQLKMCEDLWKEVKDHCDSWPFLEPVNRKAYPDYYELIENPVDLQSVRHKLNVMDYGSTDEFASDMRLMFRNCAVYNTARSGVGRAGVKLSRFFEKRLAQMGLCKPVKRGSAVH
ncbi:bromodomain adjacent to zinc finger domain protein 1A-like isoform X2 [Corticium candelabrum]|uniref:bromodomain adjacent to zinc finger domain protein 1A-like isoform X2 n=1 Tax=Corticium candelabrum TaxID=121492 RepID=UPI002E260533|nr:bromodomain adjacent to zinc finger domain protein 1A-like isoform X2 [Corticium candelabrum]